jgi:hypothetical protein
MNSSPPPSSVKIFAVDLPRRDAQNRRLLPIPMHPAPASVRYPPSAQLPHGRFAPNRQLARPFAVDPEAKSSPGDGQIDQFDFELLASLEVANDHAVVRFDSLVPSFTLRASRRRRALAVRSMGARHASFSNSKVNNARKKSRASVHAKIHSSMSRISPTSR